MISTKNDPFCMAKQDHQFALPNYNCYPTGINMECPNTKDLVDFYCLSCFGSRAFTFFY